VSSNETIVYRRAGGEDTDEIVRLWTCMMAEHSRFDPRIRLSALAPDAYAGYLAYHLESPDSICLVAETAPSGEAPASSRRKAKLAGFCLAFISTNLAMFEPRLFGYISDIMVEGPYRRQGVGTQLLERTEAWMRQRGIGVVQLQVYSRNEVGQAFWAKRGFSGFFDRLWRDLGA